MVVCMRLSTVILPIYRWHEQGRKVWQRAENLGFHAAYTYGHLSWRTFRDGPWFGTVPTLTAAAAVTEGIRLGTLGTSVKPRSCITI
jgi:alkanesulfonate monooxygenase SsuD/methylene tetrahydromethanopterin reductase-like flavin-dependent oxidoreductase (luciferase family)